jgi:hypothetical protein
MKKCWKRELDQLHTSDSTEQMFVSKRAAGTAFQVLLKCLGLQSLRERSIENQIPRREFAGVMWIYHYCVRILECGGLELSRNRFSGGTSGCGECRCRTRKPAFALSVGAVYDIIYLFVKYTIARLGRRLWRALLLPLASQYLCLYLELDGRKCEQIRRSSRKRAKEKWRRGESNCVSLFRLCNLLIQ